MVPATNLNHSRRHLKCYRILMMCTTRSSRRTGKGKGAEEGGFKSWKLNVRKEVRRCCTCLSSVANACNPLVLNNKIVCSIYNYNYTLCPCGYIPSSTLIYISNNRSACCRISASSKGVLNANVHSEYLATVSTPNEGLRVMAAHNVSLGKDFRLACAFLRWDVCNLEEWPWCSSERQSKAL